MGDRSGFFYGTLMVPQILGRVIQRPISHLTIIPAILPNHSRRHIFYADYPGMIPQDGSEVRGTFVAGLNDEDIRKLDRFEGPPYVRKNVWVKLVPEKDQKVKEGVKFKVERDGLVEAESYIFVNKEDLANEEWDYEQFKKEKLHKWLGSNEEYGDVDDAETELTGADAEDFGAEKDGKSSKKAFED